MTGVVLLEYSIFAIGLLEQIETRSRKIFGEAERYATEKTDGGNESAIGMDIMEMFNDMPVVSVLMFQQDSLPMPAEEMMAGFLQQVHSIK